MRSGETAFSGTAAYYARYRPPYPADFLRHLRACARTTGRGALLDLACGPGRVAIPLAPHFVSVLAVDVEAEMIDVGQQKATIRGAANIEWRVARAEDLQLPSGSRELITIGEAFHRLDQPRILQRSVDWLRPGGSLATLAGESVWRGREPWKRTLVDVVNRWTAGALGDPNAGEWGGPLHALRAAGLTVQEYQSTTDQTWTCDSIIGFMFSTSVASRPALGVAADGFEAELRAALLRVEPTGRFASKQKFGFTLGTK